MQTEPRRTSGRSGLAPWERPRPIQTVSNAEGEQGRVDDHRFYLQTLSVLISKAAVLASGVLATVILARTLGPSGLGIYTAIFAVITIVLTLADLGVRQAVAYTMGQSKFDDQTIIGNVISLVIMVSLLAVTVVTAILLTGPARAYGLAVLAPAIASVPLLLIISYVRGVALAKGWLRRFNLADLLQKVGFVLFLTIGLVVLRTDVGGATSAYLLAAFVAGVYSLRWLGRLAPLRPRLQGTVIKQLLGLGVVYAIVLFSLSLNYRIDILLIERMLTAEDVGLYAVGARFAELIWQLPAAVGVVLFSSSARSAEATPAVARTAATLRLTLPVVALLCVLIVATAGWLLPAVFGPVFAESVASTRLLMPGVVTAVVFKILYADMAGRGNPRVGFWVFVPLAAVNVALNLVWIPRFGIEGAAAATTLTYVLGAIGFSWRYIRLEGVTLDTLFVPRRRDVSWMVRHRDDDAN